MLEEELFWKSNKLFLNISNGFKREQAGKLRNGGVSSGSALQGRCFRT